VKRKLAIAAGVLLLALLIVSRLSQPPAPPPSPATAPAPTLAVPATGVLARTVFAHYYAWYSAPPFTPDYEHWDGGDPRRAGLPANIAASSYPALDPYASANPDVVHQHMAWLKMAGVQVLIYSWWGQGNAIDARVLPVMDAAAQEGLSVAFQLEPYSGRTFAGALADITYLNRRYGSHPAFFRASRPTEYGPSTAPRGLVFIYDPPQGGTFDSLRGTPGDSIILARQNDARLYSDADIRASISGLHLDGVYNYGQYVYAALPPISSDYLAIYSASPGFDNGRSGTSRPVSVPRQDGKYYDSSWQGLAVLKPEAVAVVSFNEWHEDTQIEPARPFSYGGYRYSDYDGAYGLAGEPAQLGYLTHTADWVRRYKS
jgi:hypothetical protein